MNLYESLNIKKNEYDDIVKRLKRTPNTLDLYLFSAMWSEHCGYKHSKKYINFYNKGAMYKNENAGGIKINNHIIFFLKPNRITTPPPLFRIRGRQLA